MRLLRYPLKLKRLNPQIVQERIRRIKEQNNNENTECEVKVENEEGALKFSLSSLNMNTSISHSMSSKSHLNETCSDSLNNTIVEEQDEDVRVEDEDSDSDFYQSKGGPNLDTSKYLSCASLMSSIKKHQSIRNLETSSRLSSNNNLIRNSRNSLHGSVSSISGQQRRERERNQLNSNRYPDASSSTCALVDHLRNPKYLLPAEVDEGAMIQVIVTEVVECGHFWAQIFDEPHRRIMKSIQNIMNKSQSIDKSMSRYVYYRK